MLKYEKAFWHDRPGEILAGVDEAGRGCLAGPVTAAAVVIPQAAAFDLYAGVLEGLTDSKQLTAEERAHYFGVLTRLAGTRGSGVRIGIGWGSVEEIDTLNILNATHLAMRRAVENLKEPPAHVLVDGLAVRGLPCDSTPIKKGDSKSLLIAAASVIAKVSRDRFMLELDLEYPVYGFARHKAYGTPQHIEALLKYGASPVHRKHFRPVADLRQIELDLDD